jgi:hypothetical protein
MQSSTPGPVSLAALIASTALAACSSGSAQEGGTGAPTQFPPDQSFPVFLVSGPQGRLEKGLGAADGSESPTCNGKPFGWWYEEETGGQRYCQAPFNPPDNELGRWSTLPRRYGYVLAFGYQQSREAPSVLGALGLTFAPDGYASKCGDWIEEGGNALGKTFCTDYPDWRATLLDELPSGPLVRITLNGNEMGEHRMLPLGCQEGRCVAPCEPGSTCSPPADPCHAGTVRCEGWLPVCEPTSTPLRDGTRCGADQVCFQGSCISCKSDEPCTPQSPCHQGRTTCSDGQSRCEAASALPDGTACGEGMICQRGICEKSDGTACFFGTECASSFCNCTDAGCLASVCSSTPCVCGWGPGGDCSQPQDPATSSDRCKSGSEACYGMSCLKRDGQGCVADSACGSGNCECSGTIGTCEQRTCASANCVCKWSLFGRCEYPLEDGQKDPEDCDGPLRACYGGECRGEAGAPCNDAGECRSESCDGGFCK